MSDVSGNLDDDSLRKLNVGNGDFYIFGRDFVLTFQNTALDMLKSSGSLNLLRDKALYRSIMDCYASLETLKADSDAYMARKTDEKYRVILEIQEFNWRRLEPEFRRIFYFFASKTGIDQRFRNCARQIENTITMLQHKTNA